MKFSEIPQLIPDGGYEINMPLDMLEEKLVNWEGEEDMRLQLNPDFQRGHVWTEAQQIAYVEYFFQGGRSGKIIYFNHPRWSNWGHQKKRAYDEFVCVDGLQRLTALRRFLADELRIFGQLRSEFGERLRMAHQSDSLKFNINNLQTKAEVLTWYLQMNTGGTPHTAQEIDRVRELLAKESALAPTKKERTGEPQKGGSGAL